MMIFIFYYFVMIEQPPYYFYDIFFRVINHFHKFFSVRIFFIKYGLYLVKDQVKLIFARSSSFLSLHTSQMPHLSDSSPK